MQPSPPAFGSGSRRNVLSLPLIALFTNAGEGGWPAYLLWVNSALLFKGEEKCHAMELVFAEVELLNKMTSPWDSEVYGDCPYMLAYAVGGNMLSIVAIKWVKHGCFQGVEHASCCLMDAYLGVPIHYHNDYDKAFSTTVCTGSRAWANHVVFVE